MALLFLYVGFALGVSFLCSLLEASLLASRNASLFEKKRSGSKGAGILLEFKQKRIDDAISAILTLNTVSNTLGATLAGAQASRVFGSSWVGAFSGVLTFLILILSEIIPKTLGAVYWLPLSGVVGHTLKLLTWSMTPVLLMSRSITRLLTRDRKVSLSRGEVAAVIASATRDGAIGVDESKIFGNLLSFDEIKVQDVMTPRTVTFMLPATAKMGDLLTEPEARVFSRIPIYRDERDNVVGYVLQRDVLRAVAEHGDRSGSLEPFLRSVHFIPEMATLSSALQQILERREPIMMVTDEHGGVEGLVTLEDLTETILGVEIVDESDRVADLRDTAMRLREKRLERLREKRSQPLGTTDPAA